MGGWVGQPKSGGANLTPPPSITKQRPAWDPGIASEPPSQRTPRATRSTEARTGPTHAQTQTTETNISGGPRLPPKRRCMRTPCARVGLRPASHTCRECVAGACACAWGGADRGLAAGVTGTPLCPTGGARDRAGAAVLLLPVGDVRARWPRYVPPPLRRGIAVREAEGACDGVAAAAGAAGLAVPPPPGLLLRTQYHWGRGGGHGCTGKEGG